MVGLALKTIYTIILLALIGLLGRELLIVWSRKLFIGNFDVIDDKGRNVEESACFPSRIVSAQELLARQLVNYQSQRGPTAPSDETFILPGQSPVTLPSEVLAGLDITIQDVNITRIFSALRRRFHSPQEISGHVVVHSGQVAASLDWPSAPAIAQQPAVFDLKRLLVPTSPNLQDAATYVASSISWARAAERNDRVANIPRIQFCEFALALNDLFNFADEAHASGRLSEERISRIRAHALRLKRHFEGEQVYSELYRVRADLLDLLPEGERTLEDLVEAQEDRIRYAMLDPDLADLDAAARRVAALVLARPALLLENDKPKDIPDNWKNLLSKRHEQIRTASQAIGAIVINGDKPADDSPFSGLVGTGFIVAPGLVMTASHVFYAARPDDSLTLCLGYEAGKCTKEFEIGEIVYKSTEEDGDITIAKLRNHNAVSFPPLSLYNPLPEPKDLTGKYAFIIGYPTVDRRFPQEFQTKLIGEIGGRKRLLPGRILAFGRSNVHAGRHVITTDISTSGGTSGAPLIDLDTGLVLGVHMGGIFQAFAPPAYRNLIPNVKFAFSSIISDGAFQVVDKATRGEEIEPLKDPADDSDDQTSTNSDHQSAMAL